jgi:hypothetical protein
VVNIFNLPLLSGDIDRNMFIQCYGKIYSIQHYVIKIGSELRSGNPDPSDFILLEWSGNE